MRWLGLLVLLVVLAGCSDAPLGAPKGPPDPDDAGALVYERCRHQLAFLPVDADQARALVPEGFSLTGTVPGRPDLLVLTTRCDVLANDGRPVQEALAGLLVEPPAALANGTAELHFVYVAVGTTSDVAAATYQAWGIGADKTSGDMTVGVGPMTASGEARFGASTLRTQVAGSASEGAAGSVRGFAARDGQVAAIVDYVFPEYLIVSGAALFEDPAGWSGFAGVHSGLGFHEYGDGYGLVLRPVPVPTHDVV